VQRFSVFASSTWALFPLIVRRELERGPEVYGFLLTCIGVGAIGGAMMLPRLRARFSRDALVAGATVLYAIAALTLAHVHSVGLLAVAMLATGVAWMAIVSTLQVSAQLTLPAWVRARGLAAFVTVFLGGMALGAILWGQVATWTGIPLALTLAAGGMVAALALTWQLRIGDRQALDFTPTMDWPLPALAEAPEPDVPVLVTIEYRIRSDKRTEFVAAMQDVRRMRRRNGAYFWQLVHDSEDRHASSSASWTSRGSSTSASTSAQALPTVTFSTGRRRFSRRANRPNRRTGSAIANSEPDEAIRVATGRHRSDRSADATRGQRVCAHGDRAVRSGPARARPTHCCR
jgi:MFS family permease